jgi:hypothetical protein
LALVGAYVSAIAQPIPIFGIVELSGSGTTAGTNYDNGVRLAVAEINTAGVILGRKIDTHLGTRKHNRMRFANMLEKNGGPAVFGADLRFRSLNGRNTNGEEVPATVKSWVSNRYVAEVLTLWDDIDVPSAKVQYIDEVINDPQIQVRGRILQQAHPRYGTLRFPNLPFRFSDCDTNAPMQKVAPDIGADNATVAASLGYSDAEIAELESADVLYKR